jgi:thiamine biosynthesis lipoprotein
MGTWFELFLAPADPSRSHSITTAVFEEIDRIERLLSRFDPTSEVTRINRSPRGQKIHIDWEMHRILLQCRKGWKRTEGFFCPLVDAAGSSGGIGAGFDSVEIEEQVPAVTLLREGMGFDFGAYGKGYALDQARCLLLEYGVRSALMHAGTSSVMAMGQGPEGNPWTVALRHPTREGDIVETLPLADVSLSCSSPLHPGQKESDLTDPRSGKALRGSDVCAVIAESGAWAEIFSTGLLAMGRNRATQWSKDRPECLEGVAWVSDAEGCCSIEWLVPR